jgi:transcriptional regulator with XRE-family HTH domain
MSEFSTRLKIALKNKGIKASVLAYRIGVNSGTITNYLKGKYEPKTSTVLKICEVLECDPEWLSGYNSPAFEIKFAPEQPELSEGEKELLALFKSVPDEHRDMALQVVQGALSALKKK